jgi:hypothetical protein
LADLDVLLDLLDLTICAWNGSRMPGTSETRNQALARAARQPSLLLRRLTKAGREFAHHYDMCFVDTIGKTGRLYWKGTYYHFPGGNSRMDLCGKDVFACGHTQDIRALDLHLFSTGESLGTVKVGPSWSRRPHSVFTREMAAQLRGSDFQLQAADMSLAVRLYMAKAVEAGTAAPYQLARIVSEQGGVGAVASSDAQADEGSPPPARPSPAVTDKLAQRPQTPVVVTDEMRRRLDELGPAY